MHILWRGWDLCIYYYYCFVIKYFTLIYITVSQEYVYHKCFQLLFRNGAQEMSEIRPLTAFYSIGIATAYCVVGISLCSGSKELYLYIIK